MEDWEVQKLSTERFSGSYSSHFGSDTSLDTCVSRAKRYTYASGQVTVTRVNTHFSSVNILLCL